MRGPAAVALALLLLGGSAAAGTASSTSGATLTVGGVQEGPTGGVQGFLNGGPNLQFIPHKAFAMGYGVQNTSETPVVVTGARVLAPSNTLVHQIGVRFHHWDPPACSVGTSCPPTTFRLAGKAAHPRPFTIQPAKYLGLELDFRMGGCTQAPTASYRTISELRLSFEQDGVAESTVVQLGDALSLRKPKPADCTFPRSRLYVNGPNAGASWLFTYPGSEGDVCTVRHGTLSFTSRAYENAALDPQRIRIEVPRFAGTRTYDRAVARLSVYGSTTYRSVGSVRVTKATRTEIFGTVDAGKPPPPHVSGGPMPYRIWGSMRCRVVR